MTKLSIDFETYCELDLKTVGLENYLAHPSFTVTAVAWAFGAGSVQYRTIPQGLPAEIHKHIEDGGEIHAWNAAFEYAVLNMHYKCALMGLKSEQMICTMQRALAYGLPGSLLEAGKAMKAPHIKDETKRALMLQMSRPRLNGGVPWHCDGSAAARQKLAELGAYCADDVKAERALADMLPPLPAYERALSRLDQRINSKGFRLDRQAVRDLRAAAKYELAKADFECATLTKQAVTAPGSQGARLAQWLNTQGLILASVDKASVAQALASPGLAALNPAVRRVLEIRQMAAKSSVAKLDAMLNVMSAVDDRARNLLQFYGAGRTGRWAGRLIQPQNLPKVGKGLVPSQVIAAASTGPDVVGLVWENPLAAISQCLRACFMAREGCVLLSVDFSQIEARVLAWLAGQKDVLDAFRQGDDVYTMTARKVGSANRQLGKVLVLACGYGMGAAKFRATAASYGVTLDDIEAGGFVRLWRMSNPNIVNFWYALERAFGESVSREGEVIELPHGMAVRTKDGVTQIRKPNGVKLTYHNLRFEDGELVFDGVNSVTKKWGTERTYGGRFVENLTQSIARDVMADAMLRVERRWGHVPVMTVHDDMIWELSLRDGQTDKHDICAELNQSPVWAPTLPIASDPHVGVRYRA